MPNLQTARYCLKVAMSVIVSYASYRLQYLLPDQAQMHPPKTKKAKGAADKPRRTPTLEASQRPTVYRHLILRKNWHIVDPQRKKHLGTKKNCPAPHGVLTFVEMSRKISSNWKTIDEETKRYCHEMALKELVRYRKDIEAFTLKYGREAVKKAYKRKTHKKTEPAHVESKDPIPAPPVLDLGETANDSSFEIDNDSQIMATNANDFPNAFHPVDEDEEIRLHNIEDYLNAGEHLSGAFCMPITGMSLEQPDNEEGAPNVANGMNTAIDHGELMCLDVSSTHYHQGSKSNNFQCSNKYWIDGNIDSSFRSMPNKHGNNAPGENRDHSLPNPFAISMNNCQNMASFPNPEATSPSRNAPTMREAFESMFNNNSMLSSPSFIEGHHPFNTEMPQQWSRMDRNQISSVASSFAGDRRSSLPDAFLFPSFGMPPQAHFTGDGAMGQSQSGNNQKYSRRFSLPNNYCL